MPSIIFLNVKTPQDKLSALCRSVHTHFEKGERVVIQVPNEEAARFIDLLLWKSPPESFIPHCISFIPANEQIVITTAEGNVNQAQVLVNLRSEIPTNPTVYALIYELYDTTHPDKEQLSLKKQQGYHALGLKTDSPSNHNTRQDVGRI